MSQSPRQLAAIMFTDIVGYTAMMQHDEQRGIEVRRRHRKVFDRKTEKYKGRILQYYGDGTLSVFGSAIDAVECGIEMQIEFQKEPQVPLRIGIHIGDIVFSENEVIGDGVNIASRIQSLSISGSVLISRKVHDEIKNQPELEAKALGYFELKNVDRPMQIFALTNPGLVVPQADQMPSQAGSVLPRKPATVTGPRLGRYLKFGLILIAVALVSYLVFWFGPGSHRGKQTSGTTISTAQVQDKSIAVLPFQNLSPDQENEYFADGQMEAILNHLAKISDLRVISRTTMMSYRGTAKSVPDIARELGVRYVLEGSVQKVAQKVRINAQLIDSELDQHLWSENFDRDLTDIFAIQTEIAKRVAKELTMTLTATERTRIEAALTSNLTAYDYYLRGENYLWRSYQSEDFHSALQMFRRAVELDPDFTLAWLGLASTSRAIYWFRQDRSAEHLARTKRYLDRAISLDPDLAEVQLETGRYYYHCESNYARALEILQKLKSEYPNDDQLHFWAGLVYRRLGEFQKAYEYMEKAILLNPSSWENRVSAGETLVLLSRYSEAERQFKTAIDLNPSWEGGYINLAALYLNTAQLQEARDLLANNPHIDPPVLSMFKCKVELADRNLTEAVKILENSSDHLVTNQFDLIPKAMQLGLIYDMTSQKDLARVNFLQAKQVLEDRLQEMADDSRVYSSLGIVYAGLGLTTEALSASDQALAIANKAGDKWIQLHRELDLARILLMVGEHAGAIAKLESLLQSNGELSVELLKIDPFWDPLRDLDDFKALIQNPRYQVRQENT